MAGTILYKLSLDAAKFEAGLKNAERQLQRTADKFSSIGSKLSTYVTAPLLALGGAAVIAFDQSAKAIAQVEAGLKSTGNAVGFTSGQLQKMAADLQKTTLFDDDEILKGATAQLLTFTNIAGEQFAKAQEQALNLATRLDGDLKSAAIMVGKALNDPVKGLSAMSRAGVQFSADQAEVIKGLAQTGQLAKAQTLILAELEKQYGGSAAAAVTGAGKIIQLKNAMGDLMEEIGKILMGFLDPLIDKLRAVTDHLAGMSDQAKENAVKWGLLAAAIGPVAIVISKVLQAVKYIVGAFTAANVAVVAIGTAIAGAGLAVWGFIKSFGHFAAYFQSKWEEIQLSFLKGKGFIMEAFSAIINGIVAGVNSITNKLGLGNLLGYFDISDTIKQNDQAISELQEKVKDNPYHSWTWAVLNWKSEMADAVSFFSKKGKEIEAVAQNTGAVIAANLGGGLVGGGATARANVATPAKMESKGPGIITSGFDIASQGLASMESFLQRQAAYLAELNKSWWEYFDVVGYVADTVPRITEAFGQMIAGTKGAFKSLVSDMLSGLKRIIDGLLAQAIAGIIAGESKKGLLGLITASVGIGALTALWNTKVPKMAKGGIIPNGFDNDKYPAMLSSGETVLPKPIALGAMNYGGIPDRVEMFMSYNTLNAFIDFNRRINGA